MPTHSKFILSSQRFRDIADHKRNLNVASLYFTKSHLHIPSVQAGYKPLG